jgi:HAD superfamily hydrolase (TIGR01450 family)
MTAYERVLNAQAILLDWDGCVVEDGRFKPGAHRFLHAFGSKTSIISNNSTSKSRTLAAALQRNGIALPATRIHLAGQTALEWAASTCPDASVWVVGEPSMCALARSLGLNRRYDVDDKAVLLLRDTRFSYRKLDRIANLLRSGARLIVANPDLTHPRGEDIAPETGALLSAISACVDLAAVQVDIIGKPHPILFEQALRYAGVAPSDALMIGDNPETDIEGAGRLGIDALLLKGVVSLEAIMNQAKNATPQMRARA